MKKIVFLLVCLLALQTAARADDKPVEVSQLPQTAQQFIKQYFPDQKIAMAKVDNGVFDKSYEVIFNNGNKIEFDKKGNWKDVDCIEGLVPDNVVPVAIRNYKKKNYPGTSIIKIDRDKKDYEVKLSNKLELKFDMKFNLINIDN